MWHVRGVCMWLVRGVCVWHVRGVCVWHVRGVCVHVSRSVSTCLGIGSNIDRMKAKFLTISQIFTWALWWYHDAVLYSHQAKGITYISWMWSLHFETNHIELVDSVHTVFLPHYNSVCPLDILNICCWTQNYPNPSACFQTQLFFMLSWSYAHCLGILVTVYWPHAKLLQKI